MGRPLENWRFPTSLLVTLLDDPLTSPLQLCMRLQMVLTPPTPTSTSPKQCPHQRALGGQEVDRESLTFLPFLLLCLSLCSQDVRPQGPALAPEATQIPAEPGAQGAQGDSP